MAPLENSCFLPIGSAGSGLGAGSRKVVTFDLVSFPWRGSIAGRFWHFACVTSLNPYSALGGEDGPGVDGLGLEFICGGMVSGVGVA